MVGSADFGSALFDSERLQSKTRLDLLEKKQAVRLFPCCTTCTGTPGKYIRVFLASQILFAFSSSMIITEQQIGYKIIVTTSFSATPFPVGYNRDDVIATRKLEE